MQVLSVSGGGRRRSAARALLYEGPLCLFLIRGKRIRVRNLILLLPEPWKVSSQPCFCVDVHTEAVQAALARYKERKVPMPSRRRSALTHSSVDTSTPPGMDRPRRRRAIGSLGAPQP